MTCILELEDISACGARVGERRGAGKSITRVKPHAPRAWERDVDVEAHQGKSELEL